MKSFSLPFYIKSSIFFVGLYTFIHILSITQDIIVPLIFSAIIALVLQAFVSYQEKKGIPKIIAISIALVLLLIFGFVLIFYISSQLTLLADSIPKIIERQVPLLENLKIYLGKIFHLNTNELDLYSKEVKDNLIILSKSFIKSAILNVGNILFLSFLIPVYLFMFLYYQTLLKEVVYQIFKNSNKEKLHEIIESSKKIIQKYLVGLLLESSLIAGLNITGLLILGIDFAIILGLIGGIINAIPYVGGLVGALLPLFIALATKPPIYAILVLGLYIFIQFIDNNIIMPYIVANNIQVNGLISVIVVILGGELWGVSGMFLSIPIVAIGKIIFDYFPAFKPLTLLIGNQENN
jgi:predicted PurR-regulated permease PerM